MSRKAKLILGFAAIASLAIFAVLILFPLEVEVSPPLQIKAVNREDYPVSGCRIEQRWAWWGVEYDFHRSLLTTDANGLAYFDRRVSRASR